MNTVLEFTKDTTITFEPKKNVKRELVNIMEGITIEHELSNPTILVLNEKSEKVEVSIDYPSSNTVQLSWNGMLSGTVYLLD